MKMMMMMMNNNNNSINNNNNTLIINKNSINHHLQKQQQLHSIFSTLTTSDVYTTTATNTTNTTIITDKSTISSDSSGVCVNFGDEYREVFVEPRHLDDIKGHEDENNNNNGNNLSQNWRTKERSKTVSVGIVLCLNIGIDPPDIIKPIPHAVLQAWTDPFALANKASETIANNLKEQYQRLNARPRYKFLIDPTIEEVKKLLISLRKTSKEERVLFHYNGHGVPKPTLNGEIWVFNRNYTQYIPLSLYDIQQWMGSPSIYVFDCSNAGIILETFQQSAIQHQKEYEMNLNSGAFLNTKDGDLVNGNIRPPPVPNYQNCILLAACSKGEILQLHPDLPADVFTSCLTTPIKTYLLWFLRRNGRKLTPEFTLEFIDKIPGEPGNRKTILGELHWIFTAVTDTIAWNTLPLEQFQRLFRQDSLVASLFRNFLLAQRILRFYDCTPVSNPFIKSTHSHPMWEAWDFAVDHCLSQLFKNEEIRNNPQLYVPSPFFTEQLTAFQVWLKLDSHSRSMPEKLPIVLQVLLSQAHRCRALDLLGNFLNLGSWAVNMALSVGIYPYVLKLLQSSMRELRPFLVFIWAKILAIDESSQNELIRDNTHRYFMTVLTDSNISINHQVMSAFILSVMIRHNPNGQQVVVQNNSDCQFGSIIDISLNLLMDDTYDHPDLRKWLIICLGNVWENNEDNRWLATRNAVHEQLYASLNHSIPEVRASAVFALGTFINSITQRNEHANEIDRNIVSILLQKIYYDSSPLVRKELLVALHWFILIFENNFLPVFRKKAFENHIAKQQYMNRFSGKNAIFDSSIHQSMLSVNHANNYNSNVNIPGNNVAGDPGHFRQISRDKMSQKLLTVPENVNPDAKSNKNNDGNFSAQFTPPNSTQMKNSHSFNSSLNTSTQSLTSIFDRVWHAIELYRLDPHPEIASLASIIYNDISLKSFTSKDNCSDSSEPSSPTNRPKYLSNESPLTNSMEYTVKPSSIGEQIKHHSGRVSVSGLTSPYLPHSSNHALFINQYTMKRKIFGKDPSLMNDKKEYSRLGPSNEICEMQINSRKDSISPQNNSLNDFSYQACRKPLITTAFVDWCTKQFSQPCSPTGICSTNELSYHDEISEWRMNVIQNYYSQNKTKLLHDDFITMNAPKKEAKKLMAHSMKFHPFEKYLATADNYNFSIWNYSYSNAPVVAADFYEAQTFKNDHQSSAKISDLQIINTHGKALLLVATDDSAIRVWRNLFPMTFAEISMEEYESHNLIKSSSKPKLSSAFFMFEDLPLRSVEHRKKFVIDYDEQKQRIVAGGDNKTIRIWDANYECKVRDISTGSDVVTSINIDSHHFICVGCEDGTVRVFDDRLTSNEGHALSFTSKMSSVVNAKFSKYSDSINMISGHVNGDICWYDQRITTKAAHMECTKRSMTSMEFHNLTDIFTCSFECEKQNSEIQYYSWDALKGSTIKLRNRNVQKLSFHPLKAKIAIATTDSIVTIYKSISMRNQFIYNL